MADLRATAARTLASVSRAESAIRAAVKLAAVTLRDRRGGLTVW